MNTFKGTPGPWRVRKMRPEDKESDFFVEANNNNKPNIGYGIEILGDDYGDHNGYPYTQRLYDAQLIACALEMLEMLQKLETVLLGSHMNVEADWCKTIIQKATTI